MNGDTRYDIFISSTFDLVDQRNTVDHAIASQKHNCIRFDHGRPAGTELDVEITKAIKSCDIFMLILGHRYGTDSEENNKNCLSFTEKEFRLAKDEDKHILAFLQKEDEIKVAHTDDYKRYWKFYKDASSPYVGNMLHLCNVVFSFLCGIFMRKKNNTEDYKRYWKFYEDASSPYAGNMPAEWSSKDHKFGVDVTLAISEAADYLRTNHPDIGYKNHTLHTSVMDRLDHFSKLGERSSRDLPVKLVIANELCKILDMHLTGKNWKLFLDSGSTLAHIASAIGEKLKAPADRTWEAPPQFITNNVLSYLHLWLIHDVPCTFFPIGPLEKDYGTAFGPLSNYGRDNRKIRLNENRENLTAEDIVKISGLRKLATSWAQGDNSILIVSSVSGLQFSKPESDAGSSEGGQIRLELYVNNHLTMLFKRYLIESGYPILFCLDSEKISFQTDGQPHYIFDEDFTWKDAQIFPIGFLIGFPEKEKEESRFTKKFDDLGLEVGIVQRKTVVVANSRFLEKTGIVL